MNWKDSEEQAAFRDEVRAFIRERFPARYVPDTESEQSLEPEDVYGYNWVIDRRSDNPERRSAANEWAAALAEKGWVAPNWPKEYGGAGLGVMEEFILHEEMMRARVPTVNGIGVFLMGPTLLQYGTEEQRRKHLPKISSGEEAWAQGFSEPNAGSDLAGVRTRAVREGDAYIVNGQKVWISQAQYADWLMVLARTGTDPEQPRHRQLTFLIMDIKTPGITVRPIVDMRGDTPYNEIFLEDVRVPVENRIGDENRGFYVAMSTLDFERSGIGSTIKYEQALLRLINFMKSEEAGTYLRRDWRESVRKEIAQRYIEIRVLYNLALHTVSKQAAGESPDYAASINQLFSFIVHDGLAGTGAKTFGQYGNLWQREDNPLGGFFTHDLIDVVAQPFIAGSAEIQRNVIATRGLGLPRA
ncbi:MAG: acyl-CoA dehydrogenase family protein [Deltaproteobacteria bacterium]|nr:acyl-CoA dehydrogenase family protein [Deltaproteobacteria bacterium]